MEMASGAYPEHLAALVKEGQVTQAQLDAAVRRVLEMKLRMGLFENPYADEARAAQVIGAPEHQQASRLAAQRSMVLLRNENKALPLDDRAQERGGDRPAGRLEDRHRGLLDGLRPRPGRGHRAPGHQGKLPNARVTYEPGPEIGASYPSLFEAFTPGPKKPRRRQPSPTRRIAKASRRRGVPRRVIAVMGELTTWRAKPLRARRSTCRACRRSC